MTDLITPELVVLDASLGTERKDVLRALATLVVDAGRATNVDDLFADAWARESKTDTGIPGGLAIPHCRSAAVTVPTLVFARPVPAVDFGSFDGPADLIFFIAAPDGANQMHLALLAKLARSLMKPEFTDALRAAATPQDIVDLVGEAVADEPEAAVEAADAPAAPTGRPVLVGVTACPTGIAHTYMAADGLAAAAERAGVELHVETQGSAGSTPLDPAIIGRAVAAVFAVDVDVRDRDRFAGLPYIQAPVKRGVDSPDDLIAQALAASSNPSAARVPAGSSSAASSAGAGVDEHIGLKLKRWLLTGVSYMIPFVAGGGLLIAIGFALAGYGIALDGAGLETVLGYSLANLPPEGLAYYLGAVAFVIGGASMGFLIPALAGYIAYAIADRPGIAPGFVVGSVAGLTGAGFLGGLVGGLLAGAAAYYIGKPAVPRWLRGLMPVVIIPLGASIIASGLLLLVLAGPIALLTNGLNGFLASLTGASAVVLGIILGVMMAADLGGPINKVAYSFAVAGLGAGALDNQAPWQIMAAVMAAGMVPPLGLALATVIARQRFSQVERENGKAAWLLGAAFISEGAIPFAAADPLRVIPSGILGAATTGAIIMATGATSQAPHGGIFVFFAIGNLPMFVLAIAIGAVVTALSVVALKRWARRPAAVQEADLAVGAVPATV